MNKAINLYNIGEWQLEPASNSMSREGEVKKLEPQIMSVLILLVENSGNVVTKEELKSKVWADVVVTENVIARAISSLRKALEDNPTNPIYIETISKTGYRFIAQVKEIQQKEAPNFFTVKLPRKTTRIILAIVFFLFMGAFAVIRSFRSEPPTITYHPSVIANSVSTEYWPSISPDGRFAAFSWKGPEDDNWDVYTWLIGTENSIQITNSQYNDLRAKWSANGNYIYYMRYEEGGANIYKKSLLGDQETLVLPAPPFSFGDFDVSKDEKWILFNDRENRNSLLGIKQISLTDGSQTWLTKPEGEYNGDIHPRYSPDGKKIAFIRDKNSTSMFLIVKDLMTGELNQVTSEPISINGFDWSKDGNYLIFGTDKSGIYKLWKVDIKTKEMSIIKVGDYQMVMPRVASNGRIIYAKMKDIVNLWKLDLEKNISSLWYGTNALNLNPAFSPDGSKICFTMQKDASYEVWIADIDGRNEVPITRFPGSYLTAPCWSKDADYIYFQGFIDGQADIFRVDAKGGVSENLTKTSIEEHTPYLTDEAIYFSSRKDNVWSIWKMNLDGNNKAQLISNGYAPKFLNNKIYYCKKDQFGIWEYNEDTKKERKITEYFHPANWGAFDVNDDGIFYLNAKERRIEFYSFKTKNTSPTYQPTQRIPRIGNTIRVSPDGDMIIFAQIDHHDADIMLLEEQKEVKRK